MYQSTYIYIYVAYFHFVLKQYQHDPVHWLRVLKGVFFKFTLMHSESPKLYAILAFLRAVGLNNSR